MRRTLDVPLGPRIVVGGISGSGKTTLAKELARRIGGTHVELDSLFHKENWAPSTDEEFDAKITAALDAAGGAADGRWVVDGNYSRTRRLTWPHATTVVFLDYPFGFATLRTIRRTARRLRNPEPLWNGNRETWSNLFDAGHPIWWSMTKWRQNRRKYLALMNDPAWAHLDVVHVRRPAELRRWLQYAARP